MKITKLISATILLTSMAGCGGNKQPVVDLVTVDVSANYPEKKLILQDIMDVEYVPLETTDEFITYGSISLIFFDNKKSHEYNSSLFKDN